MAWSVATAIRTAIALCIFFEPWVAGSERVKEKPNPERPDVVLPHPERPKRVALPLGAACNSSLPRQPLPSSKLPSACAVFFVYGGIARYERDVGNAVTELKRLNPSVRTILVTDNCELQVPAIDDTFRIPRPNRKSWAPRVEFLASNMSRYFGDHCAVALALDSHVTLCDSSLHERMAHELLESGKHRHLLAANAEHAPYHPFMSSPFSYFLKGDNCSNRNCHAHLPHNFAILFNPNSKRCKSFSRSGVTTCTADRATTRCH